VVRPGDWNAPLAGFTPADTLAAWDVPVPFGLLASDDCELLKFEPAFNGVAGEFSQASPIQSSITMSRWRPGAEGGSQRTGLLFLF
jgi:hypothetical protein